MASCYGQEMAALAEQGCDRFAMVEFHGQGSCWRAEGNRSPINAIEAATELLLASPLGDRDSCAG